MPYSLFERLFADVDSPVQMPIGKGLRLQRRTPWPTTAGANAVHTQAEQQR